MKRTKLTTIACLTASMALAPHFSIADPEGQVFDPKTYGAVGDGVAEDTAAFASVVAAATTARGILRRWEVYQARTGAGHCRRH